MASAGAPKRRTKGPPYQLKGDLLSSGAIVSIVVKKGPALAIASSQLPKDLPVIEGEGRQGQCPADGSVASKPKRVYRKPFKGKGLVDTGATRTVIDKRIVQHLKLIGSARKKMHLVGQAEPHLCDHYYIGLEIFDGGPVFHLLVPAMDLCFEDIDCLIGIDVLAKLVLTSDGPKKRFMTKRWR